MRNLYLLEHDKLTVEQLATGKYEVRYQAVEPGSEGCGGKSSGSAATPPSSPPKAQEETQNPVVSSM